jgi:hypothetical protein
MVLISAAALVGVVAAPAAAFAPTPSPAVAAPSLPAVEATPPQKVCVIADPKVREDFKIHEVSGLAAMPDGGYVVINDSNPDRSAERIFHLDANCKLKSSIQYSPSALDPEDVAVAADGTIWSADIGDNTPLTGGTGNRRPTIALWKLTPGATKPIIHRLEYPDGPHDAEALLLKADSTPIIVTKELGKPAGLYVPTGPLVPNTPGGVKLQRVGEFTPAATHTSNPLGPAGSGVVTGAAASPDGKHVALRTYSDAYEWDVTDGDIVKAITTGKPRITPLPNEPSGESIAYTRDGKSFLTASDIVEGSTTVLRYAPAIVAAPAPSAGAGQSNVKPPKDTRSFFQRLSLQDLMRFVIGVGIIGVLLVTAGVIGIRRSRSQRRASAAGAGARGTASVATPDDSDGSPPGDIASEPMDDLYDDAGYQPPATVNGRGRIRSAAVVGGSAATAAGSSAVVAPVVPAPVVPGPVVPGPATGPNPVPVPPTTRRTAPPSAKRPPTPYTAPPRPGGAGGGSGAGGGTVYGRPPES